MMKRLIIALLISGLLAGASSAEINIKTRVPIDTVKFVEHGFPGSFLNVRPSIASCLLPAKFLPSSLQTH